MPNIDKPAKPRPKPITLKIGQFMWIDAEEDLKSGTEIWDYDIETNTFMRTQTGSYQLEDDSMLDVIDGVVQ